MTHVIHERRVAADDEAVQLPEWPAYEPDRDDVTALRVPQPAEMENFGATNHCDFRDQFWA